MSDSTVTLEFGVEELLFLLSALRIETLPGLGANPTAGMSADQIARALVAGFNSLRARGWVEARDEDRTLVVDTLVLALLGACAATQRLTFISRQSSDDPPQASFIFAGPDMIAIHESAEPGVHQLIGAVDEHAALAHIARRLDLDQQPAPAAHGFEITQEVWRHVTATVRQGNEAQAIDLLNAQGVSPDRAQRFIDSLGSAQAMALLVALQIDRAGGTYQADAFLLLESPLGFWQATLGVQNDEAVNLRIVPISAHDCVEQIRSLIQPEHRQG